jgi:hypothetical protein
MTVQAPSIPGNEPGKRFMNRLADPVVSALLRSPFHRVLSGSLMLITVKGRRSGREFTTPVSYVRDARTFTIVSRRGRTWWRNLAHGAPVTLRLRGRDVRGRAAVAPAGGYDLVQAYIAFREKLGHPVSATTAELAARDLVIVHVELEEDVA